MESLRSAVSFEVRSVQRTSTLHQFSVVCGPCTVPALMCSVVPAVPLTRKGEATRFDPTVQYFLIDHFILRYLPAMTAVGLDCRGDNDYLTANRQ